MADADEPRRDALVAVLGADPDLEMVTPAATAAEVATTPQVDVIVLVHGLGSDPVDVLTTVGTHHGPAWVVLTEDSGPAGISPQAPKQLRTGAQEPKQLRSWGARTVEEVLAAGARGCLVMSSTPLQIGAAIRAAARGERADLDQPVTGPLVQRTPRATPPLSQREVEVLRLVDAGLGNRQVAERLYLSLSSVKSHLSHTYGRLGVSGRAAAVAEARRQGLI